MSQRLNRRSFLGRGVGAGTALAAVPRQLAQLGRNRLWTTR